MRVTACRICGSRDLAPVLDLGTHPPSDHFLTAAELGQPEAVFPLLVVFCEGCGLLQLGHEVDRQPLFSTHYLYSSSASQSMTEHLRRLAETIVRRFRVVPGSLVVDIGSNDCTLLAAFQSHEMRTVGVDPCANMAPLAREKGVETVTSFWSSSISKLVGETHGRAAVITATNVFAHAADPLEFVRAACALLADDGILVLEFPYVLDLLDAVEFDTIYHEHLCYFALAPLRRLFEIAGAEVFDAERVPVHGGSIRLFVQSSRTRRPATAGLRQLVEREAADGAYSLERCRAFAREARQVREEVRGLVARLKAEGCRVAGYGAAAKGNTFLNYCGLGVQDVEFIADRNPMKQGRYTPGTHIPIRAPEFLLSSRPDYLLVLPWNWKDEIVAQQRRFAEEGGRFIVGIPHPRILHGQESRR